jgi:CubicO group peptidase (beta-lactamase class C family)
MSMNQAGLMKFNEAVTRVVETGQAPGIVALLSTGSETHVVTAGTAAVGGPDVERETLFRITSMTKPITAVAGLVLISQGCFGLDEPVDRLLPELGNRRVLRRMDGALTDTVAADRPITVRDLLTLTFGFGMTASMFNGSEPWPIVAAAEELQLATLGRPDPAKQPEPDTWIARLGSLPLMAQPGARWLYNTGASVLGVLVSRAAGAALSDVLRSLVFAPLAMTDTGFVVRAGSLLATEYRNSEHGLTEWGPEVATWSKAPRFEDGAAGLVSTADDFLQFARMLLRNGAPLLLRSLGTAMTSGQLTAEQRRSEGLGSGFFSDRTWGWGLSVIDDGSYGWDGGLGTSWSTIPSRDLIVIVLTQCGFESWERPASHQTIHNAALAASRAEK